MFKTILKVLYFSFAAVLAVVIYMMSYMTNLQNYWISTLNTYVQNEEFDSLARWFGGLHNSEEIAANTSSDKLNIHIYEGTNYVDETYTYYITQNEEAVAKTERYHSYDKAYYIFLTDCNFSTQQETAGDQMFTNKTGLVFFTEEGKQFEYLFIQSPTVNADTYKLKPESKSEAVLYGSRDLLTFEETYNLFYLFLDENIVSAIYDVLGSESKITGVNVSTGLGELLFAENIAVDFDFESQFYTDINPVLEAYDEYIPVYDSYNSEDSKYSTEEYEAAQKAYNEKCDIVSSKIEDGTFPSYFQPFGKKTFTPTSLIFKSSGVVVLFVVCVFIVYFLLFKFQTIRRIVFRENKVNNYRAIPNKNAKRK